MVFDLATNTEDKQRWRAELERQRQERHANQGMMKSFMGASRAAQDRLRRSQNDSQMRGIGERQGEQAVDQSGERIEIHTTRTVDKDDPRYSGMEL